MSKYVFLCIIWIILLSITVKPVKASNIAVNSAFIQETDIRQTDNLPDSRLLRLKNTLEKYRSPMIDYSEYIIQTSDKYQLPWSLVPAIAGIESSFCRKIPYNSYNCWGWENGATKFTDYKTAIEVVSKSLRNNYFSKGLDTPEKIAPIYAPPSVSWAKKVRYFMYMIENQTFPSDFSLEINI